MVKLNVKCKIQKIKNLPDEEILVRVITDRKNSTKDLYSPFGQIITKRLNQLHYRLGKFKDTNDFLIGFNFVMETIRNQTNINDEEFIKIERILKEGLKNNQIRC